MQLTKEIVKPIRVDKNLNEKIAFLTKNHISWQKLIYDEINDIITRKVNSINFKEKEEILPF